MFSDAIHAKATRLIDALRSRGEMIVTAESCTGGLIAGALTDIAGSSDAVFGGYVTYHNRAKVEMIGVDEELIELWGAVSESVAEAMANGARETAGAEVSLAVTGIAGPGGGSAEKPVGLVYLACATAAGTRVIERRFGDIGRQQVREATVEAALDLALECVIGT
jgi:nicotinamide-nucleotide amidase